jgi:3-hexulose-6-phosphate synthase
MELLLALDFFTIPQAKKLLHEVGNIIDIVEIGTPFIVQDGVHAVREIRKEFPSLKIFADLKIMDAGAHETETAIDAGADIVSVLGVTDDATIKAAVKAAHKHNKYILADMIGVSGITKRAKKIDALGVDYICVHTAFDIQSTGKNPVQELEAITNIVKNAKTAVAGGVKLQTLPEILKLKPAIVVVGDGITSQSDRRCIAEQMKTLINKEERQ